MMDVPRLVFLVVLTASAVRTQNRNRVQWNSYSSAGSCTDHNTSECGNLTKAFEEVKQYGSSVTLDLGPGCFDLDSSHVANFTNWNGLAIVGNANTEICCLNESGLTFIHSTRIEIRNVTFYGCEAVQLSSSTNTTTNSSVMSYLKFRVGLYFLSCENLAMESVTVTNSRGVGMVIYSTSGTNTFDNCHFSGNVVTEDDEFPGGGGIAIEFTYCIPGDQECGIATPVMNVSDSTYTFTNCQFLGNVATSKNYPIDSVFPHGIHHMMLGNGGGASVCFKGNCHNNTILFDSCTFMYNKADWGGGLYLKYTDQSVDNTVTVQGGLFRINYCSIHDLDPQGATAGGGVRIDFVYYPQDLQLWSEYKAEVEQNTILFNHTIFGGNFAYWGGGISFVSSRADPGSPNTNTLTFNECQFIQNKARIAFAVDLSVWAPDTGVGALMEPAFRNCIFEGNKELFQNITGYQLGIGTLYVNRVPTTFHGVTTFLGNIGTGLVVSDVGVQVVESSVLNFTGNSGRVGGAAAFFGSAWIVAHKNTTFHFQDNFATQHGGAIYAVHFGEHDLFLAHNCFIRYYKHTEPPHSWDAAFTFHNNSVGQSPNSIVRNSIFTTSTLPCVWPSTTTAGHSKDNIIQDVFCWRNWKFDENTDCRTQVETAPAKYNTSAEKIHSIKVFPGLASRLKLGTQNDYGSSISHTVFTASTSRNNSMFAPFSSYIADGSIMMYGVPDKKTTIVIETLDPRIISVMVDVTILSCPPGLYPSYLNNTSKFAHSCKCGESMFFNCSQEDYTATLYRDNCLTHQYLINGSINYSAPLVVAPCPYSQQDYRLPKNASELNCTATYRSGTLCGQCMKGYGVKVNSYRFDCMECSYYTFNWLIYLAAEFLPITVFFLVVAVLNISATSAPMNAFVFFSQIVTVPYFQNRFPWVYGVTHMGGMFEDLLLIPYSIWNLDILKDVLPGYCLSPHLNTISVLALGYLTALYPILLIVVCYVCIELHGRNFRPIVWFWKPFHYCFYRIRRSWEPKTSIIDAFATFILLSYTKLMSVSFCLLSPIQLRDVSGNLVGNLRFYFDASMEAFRGEHLTFAMLAIVVLVIFVLIPPLFLILYSLESFQKCIGRCRHPFHALHTFADAFQGCYKDGTVEGTRDCRYFAGLYFIFRIVVMIIYIIQLQMPMVQYLIQQVLCVLLITLFALVQPYKQSFYNKLDIGFFTLLAILNSLSFYSCFSINYLRHISDPVFYINYVLMFVPLVYIVGLVIYQLLSWKNWIQKFRGKFARRYYNESFVVISETSSIGEETPDTYQFDDSDIPDRLLNPQNYSPHNTYRPRDSSRGFNSDNSYFASNPSGRSRSRNYGSTRTTQTNLSDPTQSQTQEFRKLA